MNVLLRRALSTALLGTMVGTLDGCGGAKAGAPAPAMRADEPEPTTVEEALDQISRARDRLAGANTGAQRGVPAAEASRPSEPQAAASEAAPSADSSSRQPSSSKAGRTSDEGRCSSPCRALASMRRAVTALCRMTGDTDNRCTDARRTLSDGERSLSGCSC